MNNILHTHTLRACAPGKKKKNLHNLIQHLFTGKIHEIGASGISSLQGHSNRRNKCLNDFISLYGTMPLISTNVKAVDAAHEWFW